MRETDDYLQALLNRLDGGKGPSPAPTSPPPATSSAAAVEATAPVVQTQQPTASPTPRGLENDLDSQIELLKKRLASLQRLDDEPQTARVAASGPALASDGPFLPPITQQLADTRLTDCEIEALVLKFVLNQVNASGRQISDQTRLPLAWLDKILFKLKADQLLVHKGAAGLGDYVYQLTQQGSAEARRQMTQCSYCGAAPVHLQDYIASVKAQSVSRQEPTSEQIDEVFGDLLVSDNARNQIGQAILTGHGFFLYGAPGNGKTSIAERVSRAFGPTIWIPRAISIDGEIIRLYDPCQHVEMPVEADNSGLDPRTIDQRWIRIRRPTIIAGGELTMDRLEIMVNKFTGINEAPLQLKSNCGTLVIDDFGRQRMNIAELLNRWIIPLDRRHDYLNLPNGKTVQLPFDQLLIFSTNLQPRDLVDEAFLRRIPYKIEIADPTEREFRGLFRLYTERLGLEYQDEAVDDLIRRHYLERQRPFRFCQPRDLLLQVRSYCKFNKLPLALSRQAFDVAVSNYFAVVE